jgi:hypothetical protein
VTYYVRSSVLGAVVGEVNSQGQRQQGYVYASGQMIAKQWGGYLYWQHANPVTGSTRSEATQGYLYADEESGELDPLGNDVGRTDPYAADELADYGGDYTSGGNGFDGSGGGCLWNGLPFPCVMLGAVFHTQGSQLERIELSGFGGYGGTSSVRVYRQFRKGAAAYHDAGRVDPKTGGDIWVQNNSITYLGTFITGFFQQTSTLVPQSDFRIGIINLLNDPVCASFAHATIYQAAQDTGQSLESPTILGVFDKLAKGGENILFRPEGVSSGGNGQVTGSFANSNPKMEIAGRYVSTFLPPNARSEHVRWLTDDMNRRMGVVSMDYPKTVLGETMHLAGRRGFDDRQLAIAASDVTGMPGLPDPLPPGWTDTDNKWRDANSFYFHHTVLRSRCK